MWEYCRTSCLVIVVKRPHREFCKLHCSLCVCQEGLQAFYAVHGALEAAHLLQRGLRRILAVPELWRARLLLQCAVLLLELPHICHLRCIAWPDAFCLALGS